MSQPTEGYLLIEKGRSTPFSPNFIGGDVIVAQERRTLAALLDQCVFSTMGDPIQGEACFVEGEIDGAQVWVASRPQVRGEEGISVYPKEDAVLICLGKRDWVVGTREGLAEILAERAPAQVRGEIVASAGAGPGPKVDGGRVVLSPSFQAEVVKK